MEVALAKAQLNDLDVRNCHNIEMNAERKTFNGLNQN